MKSIYGQNKKKWDLATKNQIHADFSRNESLPTKTCRSQKLWNQL